MTTNKDKKHACSDCRQCQQCSESRCRVCRGQGGRDGQNKFCGMSLAEQIALFEAVKRGDVPEGDY